MMPQLKVNGNGAMEVISYSPIGKKNEPNNNWNEDYAAIEGETSQWNDYGGNYNAYAICQKSDTAPAIVWSQCYGNSCYYKTPSEMLWIEANITCVGLGAELTSVHSDEENTFVFNFCGYDSDCWMGLTDEQAEGYWEWTDGSYFDYENWGSGQPNNYWSQNYVIFDPSKNGLMEATLIMRTGEVVSLTIIGIR